jgi:hypothetical protein
VPGAVAVLAVALLAWRGCRSPWDRDPLSIGAFEDVLAGLGFVYEDTDLSDGLDGYVLRRRGGGQWAQRDYEHPDTGALIRLRRGYAHGALQASCTVRSLNDEGRAALHELAGAFSPHLERRILAAEQELPHSPTWVRVTALEFDVSVTRTSLTIDARSRELVGLGALERGTNNLLWRIGGLFGDD